jgi:hypothetical protein
MRHHSRRNPIGRTMRQAIVLLILFSLGCGEATMPPDTPGMTAQLLDRAVAASVSKLDPRDRDALRQELREAILAHSPPEARVQLAEQLRPEVLRYAVSVDTSALRAREARFALRDSLLIALIDTYLAERAAPSTSSVDGGSWDATMEVRVVLEDRRAMKDERALVVPGANDSTPPTLVLPAATTTPHELQLGLRLTAMYDGLWRTGARPRERIVLSGATNLSATHAPDEDGSAALLRALRSAERTRIAGIAEGPSMSIAVERR